MRNKKIAMIALIFTACLILAACGRDKRQDTGGNSGEPAASQPAGDSTSSGSESSGGGTAAQGGASASSYTLTSEEGSVSIQVTPPAGYEPVDYMSETMLNFERTDGWGTTNIIMNILDVSAGDATDMLRQETQYAMSANADGEQSMDETEMENIGGRTVNMFDYDYETSGMETEGYRFWTELTGGGVLVCTVEGVGSDVELPDEDMLIGGILSGISE